MHLSKREFLQVLAAAGVAGMGLGRWAEADAATSADKLYELPKFGNVSFLHITDCHAQLQPIWFREPSVNLGIAGMKGRLPHLVGEHLLKAAQVPAGSARRLCADLPGLRAGRAPLRQGRRLRPPRHPGQAHEGQPAGRAAARWRRHLAGLGHRAVDQWPGHGRCLQAAGRGRDDRPLGIHLRHAAGEADRREGLRRPGRFRRPERQDRRLRRPGVQALRDPRRSTACPAPSSARPSRTRRSPTRATSSPTGPSASRTTTCRRWSTRRAARARRWWWCSATTAWTWT